MADTKSEFCRSDRWQWASFWVISPLIPLLLEIPYVLLSTAEERLAKWPMGCLPQWEGADGTCITESAAIATHGECLSRFLPPWVCSFLSFPFFRHQTFPPPLSTDEYFMLSLSGTFGYDDLTLRVVSPLNSDYFTTTLTSSRIGLLQ